MKEIKSKIKNIIRLKKFVWINDEQKWASEIFYNKKLRDRRMKYSFKNLWEKKYK